MLVLVRLVLCLTMMSVSSAFAQVQPTENVEVEPVTCWWRTSTSAIRVGQPFSVVLTCSALETDAAKAIVDRGRLASAAVQLPPYEVTGGSQSDDVTTASRRFMQYEYTLRLIGDDVFGAEVPVPPLQVSYRIESKVQQDAAVQGREQTYILPPLPIRVASLVASSETHIREAPVPSLAAITARETRGAMLRAVGTIIFALSGLLVIVALVRSVQQRRSAVARERTHLLADRAILAGVRRELRDVQQHAAREGWSDVLAARALAALRVTASYAAGQHVAQRPVKNTNSHDGQLVLRRRWHPGSHVLISGAATANDLVGGADGGGDELRSAMADLTVARYGRASGNGPGLTLRQAQGHSEQSPGVSERSESTGGPDLNDAIERGLRATDRVAARHTWMAQTLAALRGSAAGWRGRAWRD